MIDGISKDYAKSPITLVEIFEEFAGGGRVNFYPSDSMGLPNKFKLVPLMIIMFFMS
jgi:hypothetical protein